jgi:hypothetical protein
LRSRTLDTPQACELADLFCRGSRLRVERLFRELRHNEDEAHYDAAQQVLGNRYRFAEDGIVDPADLIEKSGYACADPILPLRPSATAVSG